VVAAAIVLLQVVAIIVVLLGRLTGAKRLSLATMLSATKFSTIILPIELARRASLA